LIRRHREILSAILNTDGIIRGSELAKLCDVSVRTIRLDIKEINNLLKEYNVEIYSEIKKGYYLSEKNKKILKENNIIRSVIDYKYILETPITPFERQMYIISKLTIKDYIYIEELEDSLHVSASTVNKDIISAKKWLKENLSLNISNSLSKGLKLNATEQEKRNVISWILSYKLNNSTLTKQFNYLFEDKDIADHTSELYPIVSAETSKYGYLLSGHSSQLFCIEIMVAVRRAELGYNIENNEKTQCLEPVIIALREKIEPFLKVALSEAEWLNLQQFFLSKQFINGTNMKNIETEEAKHIVNEFLLRLKNNYNIDLLINEKAREKLLIYVAPMLNRIKYKHCIGNKINENIEQIYPFEFKMSYEISEVIKEELNFKVNLIELYYITIYLVSMQSSWREKLNTIIVCDFDEGIISYIKDKLVNYLGYKINLCGCYTYQQFLFKEKNIFKNIEFIVSTSTLADKTNIPFVQISPIIEEKDITNISVYIDSLTKKLN
jgi:lichenan operon transcriptional antiterminator